MILVYKTYKHDKEYLEYSLKSVKKFVSGIDKIYILSDDKFTFNNSGLNTEFILNKIYSNNAYHNQQIVKLMLFSYIKEDDVFLIDCDMIFTEYVDLSNQPIIHYYRYWDEIEGDQHCCWRDGAEQIFNCKNTIDGMPTAFVRYTRHLYNCIQVWLQNRGETFTSIYTKYTNVSEYVFLGNWIYLNNFEQYDMVHAKNYYYSIIQMWSHTPIKDNKALIEKYLNSMLRNC